MNEAQEKSSSLLIPDFGWISQQGINVLLVLVVFASIRRRETASCPTRKIQVQKSLFRRFSANIFAASERLAVLPEIILF